ncbi:MAG TPA: amino acid adenylation domain-containing protein [Steroidobacteraceae bacterium]|nr:amino acid adenylation domain-containing protein [Steroidobacteraceae bacterium]
MRTLADIAERVEHSLVRHAHRNAFCIAGERCSYGRLRERVLAIQSMLASRAGGNRLVGVINDDSLDAYASVLAILRAGAAFVPLSPEHPPQRNANIVGQAGLRAVCASSEEVARAGGLPEGVEVLLTGSCTSAAEPRRMAVDDSDLAYLLFTSGSTGQPKGVPITRGNLDAFLSSLQESGFGFTAGDRVLQMFDLTFDFSVASYLAPLSSGACVYPVPAAGARFAEVYRLLAEERLTVAPIVPSVLSYLRPYFPQMHLPEVRLTMLCGEPLVAEVATEWMQAAPNSRVANFYGPTEATVFATVYEWHPLQGQDKSRSGVVSIGRPMPGNDAIIVDTRLAPVATGEKGELCLAGPQLTPGYWMDPARDSGVFFELPAADGPRRYYRTGDYAVADEHGDHYFCGRAGTQVKVRGYRIELGEIEYHARDIVQGRECVVVQRVDASGGADLSLIIEDYEGDPRAVIEALRTRVPPYMVPARALSLDRLPTNHNGKIDRLALQRAVAGFDA